MLEVEKTVDVVDADELAALPHGNVTVGQ